MFEHIAEILKTLDAQERVGSLLLLLSVVLLLVFGRKGEAWLKTLCVLMLLGGVALIIFPIHRTQETIKETKPKDVSTDTTKLDKREKRESVPAPKKNDSVEQIPAPATRPAGSQDVFTCGGIVLDEATSKGVAGVSIISKDGQIVYTDADGVFRANWTCNGFTTVRLSHPDYKGESGRIICLSFNQTYIIQKIKK